jgi:LPS export ABC transporter protein LptC
VDRQESMKFKCYILILLMVSTCSGCSPRKGEVTAGSDDNQEVLPAYSLEDVTHYQYEAGNLMLKIMFEKGDFYDEQQELRVEKCSFVYYDIDGNRVSTGRSRKAVLYKGRSQLVAEDDVVVISEENGGMLQTDYLEWRGDSAQFVTESFVTITRQNGDTLQGIGMITDVALNYVTVKRDVRGSIEAE